MWNFKYILPLPLIAYMHPSADDKEGQCGEVKDGHRGEIHQTDYG